MKYFVTTPIYYVNDVPHIGHFYTTLAADILARYYRNKLGGGNVFFTVGTDEHGTKVAEAAAKHGKSPKEYVDEVAPAFINAWKHANISYDFFIRTTEPQHKKLVREVFTNLYKDGYIYKDVYEGLYCVGCEKFLTEQDMVEGKCPLHPKESPQKQKEDNYFFKLSSFAETLRQKITSGELKILPESRKNEILARIDSGLEDVSISRQTVSWGIPVPWDESQTFYVWVEAVFNYYSATHIIGNTKKFWPPQLHIMAKDILWFHAVIWPALLLAANIQLPEVVFAHGFFTMNGQKISKSLGNVLSPNEIIEKFGVDGARYLLISAFNFGSDGDVDLKAFVDKYNGDLANGLGNLISRTAKLCEGLTFPAENSIKKNTADTHGEIDIVADGTDSSAEERGKGVSTENNPYQNYMEQYEFLSVLEYIWKKIRMLDRHLNTQQPWHISNAEEKKAALVPVVEGLRGIADELEPFMPDTAQKLRKQFSGEHIAIANVFFKRI